MRWTRNDSLAYEAFSNLGDRLVDAYNQRNAGEAYKDATQVQQRNGAEIPAQYAEGIDDAGQLGYNQPQYGLGKNPSSWQDTAPTQAQIRSAGLQGMSEYYFGKGQYEKGADLQSKGLAIRQGELSVAEGERKAAAQGRVDAVRKMWENPVEQVKTKFNTDIGKFGMGNNAGKQGNLVPMPDGSGYLAWETNADGSMKGDAKVVSNEQFHGIANDAMLADLAVADPDKYLGAAIQAGHTREQLKQHADQLKETMRHNLATEDLTKEQRRLTEKQIDLHFKEITARIAAMDREHPLGGTIAFKDKDGNTQFGLMTTKGFKTIDLPPGATFVNPHGETTKPPSEMADKEYEQLRSDAEGALSGQGSLPKDPAQRAALVDEYILKTHPNGVSVKGGGMVLKPGGGGGLVSPQAASTAFTAGQARKAQADAAAEQTRGLESPKMYFTGATVENAGKTWDNQWRRLITMPNGSRIMGTDSEILSKYGVHPATIGQQ